MMETANNEEPQHFVDRILAHAAGLGASDVYFLPAAGQVNIRLRRDGIQEDLANVPREYGEQCIARIKVLARLLTYRTRISQDGVIRDIPGTTSTELRVSVMPTNHGERIAIRILKGGSAPLYLDDLNFTPGTCAALRTMLERPSGMIVLTGPTGSGKTTTIYAMIRELLKHQQDPASIITIEDPIECAIDSISQTAVARDSDWGYEAALRASLRQDVKTLVVGEMRDKEVVRMTIDAALTGHRIITTYHAGDIPSVYARLLHQGFESFLIASAITGVVTQRLIPAASGKGRIPVVATLLPDDNWRDFVTSAPGLVQLRKKLKDHPTADISRAAAELLKRGAISTGEAAKIANETTHVDLNPVEPLK